MHHSRRLAVPFVAGLALLAPLPASAATPVAGTIVRVDNLADGSAPGRGSGAPVLSADGRYSVFTGNRELNGGGAADRTQQVFRHDAVTGTNLLASRTSQGYGGNQMSINPSVSNSGRYVAYTSWATNLPDADDTAGENIYRFDAQTGENRLVTTLPRTTQSTQVAQGNISATGRFIAFSTSAPMLPADTNDHADVYLWDARTGGLTLVSRAYGGGQADDSSGVPQVSADGHVLFNSWASNLTASTAVDADHTPVYLWDPTTHRTTRVSSYAGDESVSYYGTPFISDNGGWITYYLGVYDTATGSFSGHLASYEVRTGQTTEIADPAYPGRDTGVGQMSYSGRYVLVQSTSGNVNADDWAMATEIYDRVTHRFLLVSERPDLFSSDLSADGRHVGFASREADVVDAPDSNDTQDAFVWSRS